MIYFSGKNEKLGDPVAQGEFLSFISNESRFYQANPHLRQYKQGACLPPHTPILMGEDTPELKLFVAELTNLTVQERECWWLLQLNQIDIPTLLATKEMMSEAQSFAQRFRQFCNDPLLTTPWLSTDPILTNTTLLDVIPGICGIAAGSVRCRLRHCSSLQATAGSHKSLFVWSRGFWGWSLSRFSCFVIYMGGLCYQYSCR